MFKKIFPDDIFSGNNSFDEYHLNDFYKNYVLDKEYYPYQYDDWYNVKNYGCIDHNKLIIYPKQSALKIHADSTVNLHRNLHFVVDAFNDLKIFFKDLNITAKADFKSTYSRLNVASGIVDVEKLYIEYIRNIYPIFDRYASKSYVDRNIYSINSFIEYFVKFLNIFLKFAIINRSSYIKSNLVPRDINGLRINLENVIDLDPRVKANTYIGNPEFSFFINNVGRFGFVVDKNRPWSIVSDLDSPVTKKYALQYDLKSKEEIYDVCYHKAYIADLESLKNIIVIFWNNYVNKKQYSNVSQDTTNCLSTINEMSKMHQIDVNLFDMYFNINWQLRLYLYSKILEENIKIPQTKFEVIHQEAIKINSAYGKLDSVLFINNKIEELKDRINKKIDPLTSEKEFYRLINEQVISFEEPEIKF